MRYWRYRTLFGGVLVTAAIVAGQPFLQDRRVELRMGTPKPAPPPQPEPGDVFRIDEEGDVVLERRRTSGDRERHRIPRRTKVSPEIAVEVDFVGPDRVRYTYTVRNGASARQGILTIAVGARRPDLIVNQSAPQGWIFLGPSSGHPARVTWHSFERSTDIGPERIAGPFRFEAQLLPGLTRAYIEGYLAVEEAAIDLHTWNLSPWLANKLHEALEYENNTVQPTIVGPKLEMSSMRSSRQLTEAIAEELLLASRVPEFQEHQLFLENTASYLKGAGKAAAALRGQLREMGASPLQKSFFRAMALNLEYVEKLP